MLTADLVRVRCHKGEIKPRYIQVAEGKTLELATELIEVFKAHEGLRNAELVEALDGLLGDSTHVLLHKGLIKLLRDRSTFETCAAVEPEAVRSRLFELAATQGPVVRYHEAEETVKVGGTPRSKLVAAVAEELCITAEEVEGALLADLRDNQRLTSFKKISPEDLLHRYNTALAQAVLLRATKLELVLHGQNPRRLRALLRAIKFFRLIHRVERHEGGHRITLDGPLSLFRLSQKYGVQMATFLPAVLLLPEGWSLTAEVRWSTRSGPLKLRLGPADGLKSHYRERGVWLSEEEQWFAERFEALDTPWGLLDDARIVDLDGGDVVIPDYVLRHGQDGREALLEIIWFWRKGSLEPRLRALSKDAPPNLILAISDRLRASKEDLASCPVPVHRFKGALLPKPIIKLAEQVATAEGAPARPKRRARRRKAKATR